MWKCVVSWLPPSTRWVENRSVEDKEKTVTVSSSVSNITHQDEAGIFVLQLSQRGAVPEGRVQLLQVQRSPQAPVAQRGVTLVLALSLLSLDHLGQMDLKDRVSKNRAVTTVVTLKLRCLKMLCEKRYIYTYVCMYIHIFKNRH